MSSGDRPFFTVIMATYNRGRHIVPSIRSVLAQTYGDFELLVVGDNCTDDTEAIVSSLGSRQVRWLNLERRGGSQSFPNNAGIAQARGDVVAYIGHDDIWAGDHLERSAALFKSRPDLDFAVSGGVYHLPNNIPGSSVTGLFDDDSAKHDHFFPPSTFAHRRNVCDRIGYWLPPADTKAPVDAHFLGRAAGADLQFASTGKVTVHKFAAGHRYLSYILQESDEQEAMLARLNDPDYDNFVEAIVSEAKAPGRSW
jgi:glycosyltransferase involved in cell wall biosynthesis